MKVLPRHRLRWPDAHASAARLAGELPAWRAVADSAAAELADVRQTLEREAVQLARLTDEVEASRPFEMPAVDDARRNSGLAGPMRRDRSKSRSEIARRPHPA